MDRLRPRAADIGQIPASDDIASAWPGGDLDLRAVRCLLVLGEERHYGRSAERLHMSQPGLSRVIAALETRVGAALVARNSRPVRLTGQGEVLAWHGRRLLAQQQAAFEHLAAATALDSARSAASGPAERATP